MAEGPPINDFNGVIKEEWFANTSKECSGASDRDITWVMPRIDPSHLLDVSAVDGATC